MEYTLTYSEAVKGWVSFYSFQPDWMIGMNNYFYTFKGGNLYRHNVNSVRNNFYGNQYYSQLTSVFNDAPLENKLFKTINLEGDDAWAASLITDIQTSGFIEYEWFSKKEQSYYAFVRNAGTVPAAPDEYALRSVNGIGRSIAVSGPNTAQVITFPITPLVAIGNIISIGDYVYYALPPSTALVLAGQVTDIQVNYPSNINRLVIDSSIGGAVYPVPVSNAYFLYIKNSVAESHGVLGHYCTFTLQNTNTNKIELFAAEADIMKSYP
jgi:hypothetical protein